MTSRSPAGPPFVPALPWPLREMVCPSSMPGGDVDRNLLVRLTAPLPRQVGQGWWIILPVPPQRWQGPLLCTMPKGVRFVVRTVPLPLQSGQVSAVVPGAQPVPRAVGALLNPAHAYFLLAAKAASSKLSVTPTRTLSPRIGPFRRAEEPPPKPKMSPRSPNISPKPPKPPKPPKIAEARAAAEAGVGVEGREAELVVLLCASPGRPAPGRPR